MLWFHCIENMAVSWIPGGGVRRTASELRQRTMDENCFCSYRFFLSSFPSSVTHYICVGQLPYSPGAAIIINYIRFKL